MDKDLNSTNNDEYKNFFASDEEKTKIANEINSKFHIMEEEKQNEKTIIMEDIDSENNTIVNDMNNPFNM